MKFCAIGPVAFEAMFETVILRESWVKGQSMTMTSCTHKPSCLITSFKQKSSKRSMRSNILVAFSNI